MSFLEKSSNEGPRVDLTPMVDVVFLLLIFFMISTTFVESPGLSIKLPESSAETIDREPKEIKIYLSKEGEIYYKDNKITQEAFQNILTDYGDQAPKTTFLLLADKDAKHGKVVALMDLARETGFLKLAIATEQRKK
ncbi:MAG: biopolymer transporter ExbD [Deltaproteobacteria bacterium]|jgi:biopolymer transport protein ExbD|nr:biopolymer transporter ExbD [Deltaproteobacteria bacterium]MBW2504895.1 biopolymer transporter ExbD [Deltaproteobacteria bacterium]